MVPGVGQEPSQFEWHHDTAVADLEIIQLWYKNLGYISCTGRVVANFVCKHPDLCYRHILLRAVLPYCKSRSLTSSVRVASELQWGCILLPTNLYVVWRRFEEIGAETAEKGCLEKIQESRAVVRKPRDAAAVLFGLKFADDIHYKFKTIVELRKPGFRAPNVLVQNRI